MSKTTNGGPAFPIAVQPDFQFAEPGMTLRDYFAAKAMQAIIASNGQVPGKPSLPQLLGNISVIAYSAADAMLREREHD